MPRKGQLDLFGARVGPAATSAEHRALGDALGPEIHLGTSSWSFPGWKGLVFDRSASKTTLAQEGLAAYAKHPLLRTVSLDRTYYGPIDRETYAEYAEAVPAGFRFLAKAHRDLTSRPGDAHYLDAGYAEDAVIAPFVEGLGDHAGPLVFQFPPQRGRPAADAFAEALERFLAKLPRGPLYAVEIRHTPWLTRRYAEALLAGGAVPCFTVHPSMPPIARQREVLDAAARERAWVVRWMLGGGLAYEEARDRYAPFDRLVAPDRGARRHVADLCREARRQRTPAFVAINNKAEGSAPLSAFALARAIAEDDGVAPD